MQVSTAARQLLDLTFSLAKSKETCQSLAADIDQRKCEKQSLLDRVEAHNKRVECHRFYELDQSIRQLKDERKALQRLNRRPKGLLFAIGASTSYVACQVSDILA